MSSRLNNLKSKCTHWVLLTLCLSLSPPWLAAQEAGGNLQVHGFLTQGLIKTTGNNFFGDSEDVSDEFTELGINASYRATPSLLFSGQLLSRRAGELYDGSPSIDFALLDWSPVDNTDYALGVQLGRVKNALGLYNETRDVAFTRPSIFVPQQVYFDTVRNLFLSTDSAHAYGRLYNELGRWTVNIGTGRIPVDKNVEITFLGGDFAGDLDTVGLSYIVHTEYESPDTRWRLALSAAQGKLDFDAAPADPISDGEIDFKIWIASAQYNAERWSITAEYMEEPIDFAGFGPFFGRRNSTVQGYYLQGTYLLSDDVELVTRYGEGYADKDDHSGRRLSAATGGALPPHAFYQKDWMVGLRWDVTPSFMLRAEYHRARGTGSLSARENPDPAALQKDWEMFSLLGSYRF